MRCRLILPCPRLLRPVLLPAERLQATEMVLHAGKQQTDTQQAQTERLLRATSEAHPTAQSRPSPSDELAAVSGNDSACCRTAGMHGRIQSGRVDSGGWLRA